MARYLISAIPTLAALITAGDTNGTIDDTQVDALMDELENVDEVNEGDPPRHPFRAGDRLRIRDSARRSNIGLVVTVIDGLGGLSDANAVVCRKPDGKLIGFSTEDIRSNKLEFAL